jgi:hypothetical protein
MTATKVGSATKKAIQFLEQFYRDTHSLVTTLDALMSEQGWRSAHPNRISNQLSNGLNPVGWTLKSLARIYVPRADAAAVRRAIGVDLAFSPASFEEPMCLVVAANFSQPVRAVEDIWYGWKDSERVLSSLTGGSPQVVSQDILRDRLMPNAAQASAFVLPLCELSGAAALTDRVMLPAIKLVG